MLLVNLACSRLHKFLFYDIALGSSKSNNFQPIPIPLQSATHGLHATLSPPYPPHTTPNTTHHNTHPPHTTPPTHHTTLNPLTTQHSTHSPSNHYFLHISQFTCEYILCSLLPSLFFLLPSLFFLVRSPHTHVPTQPSIHFPCNPKRNPHAPISLNILPPDSRLLPSAVSGLQFSFSSLDPHLLSRSSPHSASLSFQRDYTVSTSAHLLVQSTVHLIQNSSTRSRWRWLEFHQ